MPLPNYQGHVFTGVFGIDSTQNTVKIDPNYNTVAISGGISVGNLTLGSTMSISPTGNYVTAAQCGTWFVQPGDTPNTVPWLMSLHDGTYAASVRNLAGGNALNVSIVDAAGDQITSFSGGPGGSNLVYQENTTSATSSGSVILWKDTSNYLRIPSAVYPLPVNIVSGGSGPGGSVAVSNFPVTQGVSGSVTVSNFPATQGVSGNLAVSNTVAVSGTLTTNLGSGANNVTVTSMPGLDSFGHQVVGTINNQIDIQYYRDTPANLVTVTTANGGTASATGGMATYATTTAANSSSRGVTTTTTVYTAGAEIYCIFTAGFTGSGAGTSYQRIGLYDASNGIFLGFEGSSFRATRRKGGSDADSTTRDNFNGDTLTGAASSQFTRNGTPEALDTTKLNVFRLRFGWVGSAPLKFEVLSPDGEWVTFHTIRQPNVALLPSLEDADLPVTCDVNNGNSSQALTVITNCWAAGTTQSLGRLDATLTSATLAALTRAVITGETTAGGGGYVNVKVNPSGSLSVAADTELPAAGALGDNTANPTTTSVGVFPHWFDSSTWDRAPGNSTDGLLVNLGTNNDTIVTNTVGITGSASITNFPATQAVSGTVASTQSGSWNVGIVGTPPVSGSVSLLGTSAVSGTVASTQSGGWNVGVIGTVPVSGTVSVGNFPVTQAVSGSVTASNIPIYVEGQTSATSTGMVTLAETISGVIAPVRVGTDGVLFNRPAYESPFNVAVVSTPGNSSTFYVEFWDVWKRTTAIGTSGAVACTVTNVASTLNQLVSGAAGTGIPATAVGGVMTLVSGAIAANTGAADTGLSILAAPSLYSANKLTVVGTKIFFGFL